MRQLNRRDLLRAMGISATALLMPGWLAGAELQSKPPNIVYILADDMGFGDLACQNPQSKIATPNLDRLATQGMRFTDAHAPSAVCTPTRYALLTGRYCWRSRLKSGVLGGYSPALIEPDRLTVGAMLQQHGYATASIGKWHLGVDWPTKNGAPAGRQLQEQQIDFSKSVKNGPTQRGFDYFYGIAASLDMPPYVFMENDRLVAAPTARQEKQGYVREGPRDPAFHFDRVLPTLTKKAVDWIANSAAPGANGKPFFLYLALNAPHTPIAPSAAFKGKSSAGDYGDFVTEVDWSVGQVLKALDDAKIAGNTLVIFTSDNGPEILAYPRIQQYRHYSMGDWRGVKRDMWEGGHRVPFIARWPGTIAPGGTSSQTICHTDLLATAAAIVGAKLPADAGEDSFNILPALLDPKLDKPIREATVHHSGSGRFAIRRGTWVFIDARTGDDNREPEWFKKERGYEPHNSPGELYDLSNDGGEHRNVYTENPDKVTQLKELLEKYKREGRSAPLLR